MEYPTLKEIKQNIKHYEVIKSKITRVPHTQNSIKSKEQNLLEILKDVSIVEK